MRRPARWADSCSSGLPTHRPSFAPPSYEWLWQSLERPRSIQKRATPCLSCRSQKRRTSIRNPWREYFGDSAIATTARLPIDLDAASTSTQWLHSKGNRIPLPLSQVKRELHVAPLSDSQKGTGGVPKGNREAPKGNRVTGDSVPSELDLPSSSKPSECEGFATTGKPPDLVEALVSLCAHQSEGHWQEARTIIDRALLLLDSKAVEEIINRASKWKDKPRHPRAVWKSIEQKALSFGVGRVPDRWDLPIADYEQTPRYSNAALAAFEAVERA